MSEKFVIGVDYGTDSVRSLLVNTLKGEEIATSVFEYPRWKQGLYNDPSKNQFRQHPLDYLEGIEITIKEILKTSGVLPENITAISVDTTGSTPVAVNREGVPLSMLEGFEQNPNAMFLLWKDHTAGKEAEEINLLSHSWGGIDYTKYEGGIYSSEWFWAKVLHVLREDEQVRNAAYSWVEHCDWIPAVLTGETDPLKIKRSRCAAGHKAMWHTSFNGLPAEEFLIRLDPLLEGIRSRLYRNTFTVDQLVGTLSAEWAGKLGLSEKVRVGVGAFDAHVGAIGGEVKPGCLSKVMGTSTCDMMVAPLNQEEEGLVPGICGQVDGSIIPGMLGLEAGQSAFGDVYAWFRDMLLWPATQILKKSTLLNEKVKEDIEHELSEHIISQLSEQAAKIPVGESGIVALDWLNGRRTPDANQNLKAAVSGLTLGSEAPHVFKALVEATAFGSRVIIDRFQAEGITIEGVVALGGVAKKSPYVMQVMADVLNKPIRVARSDQTVALGAAMAAAVVGGIYPTVQRAQEAMGSGFNMEYLPDPEKIGKYDRLYEKYKKLGNFIENSLTWKI